MTTRLTELIERLRSSYWFVPTVMAAIALLLSYVMVWIDTTIGDLPKRSFWLYTGHADGAREVLSTIATAMITIATLAFSVTIVALQLAASQYGSRLLYSFMRDRANQVVLGVFVSGFLYALLVLRTIDSGDGSTFVPQLAVTLALVLALLGVAALIYFVHHTAEVIQADNLIAAVSRDLADYIGSLWPAVEQEPEYQREAEEGRRLWLRLEADSAPVRAADSGFLQAIDNEALARLAVKRDAVVRLLKRPGDFVAHDDALAAVHPAARVDDALVRVVDGAFVLGARRTLVQDVELPFQQLAEVAVRSLSPGIYDPFTAERCIKRIADGLYQVMVRAEPRRVWRADDGRIRLLFAGATFASIAEAALTELRAAGASSTLVMARLLDTLGELARRARTDAQRKVLLEHARLVHDAALPGALPPAREALERAQTRIFAAPVPAVTERPSSRAAPDDLAAP